MSGASPFTKLSSVAETRTPASGVAALVAAVALVVSVGLTNGSVAAGSIAVGERAVSITAGGVAAGGLVLGTWALAGPVYAFAFGQILFAALAPSPSGVEVGVAQVGLFGLLAVPVGRDAARETVGGFVVASAGLVGLGAGVHDATGELWPAALAVAGAVAVVSYALHRYELVVLDLMEAEA
ncbi:hypothetical protein [Halorussus salinisoli]|uniref:hypothetical protein n=1 Tax=Halorussus salinisoli TaxID=2558242 RepID=UPI0010C178BA|nr:hypothetical protein [Halorussus salinisoli]